MVYSLDFFVPQLTSKISRGLKKWIQAPWGLMMNYQR